MNVPGTREIGTCATNKLQITHSCYVLAHTNRIFALCYTCCTRTIGNSSVDRESKILYDVVYKRTFLVGPGQSMARLPEIYDAKTWRRHRRNPHKGDFLVAFVWHTVYSKTLLTVYAVVIKTPPGWGKGLQCGRKRFYTSLHITQVAVDGLRACVLQRDLRFFIPQVLSARPQQHTPPVFPVATSPIHLYAQSI